MDKLFFLRFTKNNMMTREGELESPKWTIYMHDDYEWNVVEKKFSKSNLNDLVDDQVGIAEAQPQRDQMQPSLPAFLACCWWSSWLGSLPLVVTTSKSCSLPLASDGKCSVGIVHHLCIKGNVYAPKASAELMYRWSCANSYHYVAYFWVVGFCWKRWCSKR